MGRIAAISTACLVLFGCATAQTSQQPSDRAAEDVCEDPIYQELRSTPPDSLSDKEMERLEDLEQLCQRERQMEEAQERAEAARHSIWENYLLYVGAAAAGTLALYLAYGI